jgi:hypothetical protein
MHFNFFHHHGAYCVLVHISQVFITMVPCVFYVSPAVGETGSLQTTSSVGKECETL